MDNMHARMRVPERETARAAEAPAAEPESHRYASPRPAEPRGKQKPVRNRWLLPLLGIFVLAALLFGAWKLWFNGAGSDGINHDRYQIVYLVNNGTGINAYVGKLSKLPDGYFKLSDAFYFQVNGTTTEDNKANAADIKMIKPGEEVQAPEDTIIIPREQVLHYENLQDKGKVVEAIKKYNSEKK